jgi:hypothetical protein
LVILLLFKDKALQIDLIKLAVFVFIASLILRFLRHPFRR